MKFPAAARDLDTPGHQALRLLTQEVSRQRHLVHELEGRMAPKKVRREAMRLQGLQTCSEMLRAFLAQWPG